VASVLARLRNIAEEGGLSFNDILQAYVIERFLARLARSPHAETVLLKGALMLRVWGVPHARPTMDIDLLRRGIADQIALVHLVEQCAAIGDPSDGVIFEAKTIAVEPTPGRIWLFVRSAPLIGNIKSNVNLARLGHSIRVVEKVRALLEPSKRCQTVADAIRPFGNSLNILQLS
jgi:hypothetical protein